MSGGKIENIISELAELLELAACNEFRNYITLESTLTKVEFIQKLIRELRIAESVIDMRSSSLNTERNEGWMNRSVQEIEMVRLLSQSALLDMPIPGSFEDLNDPNTIRHKFGGELADIRAICKGIYNDIYDVNINDHIGYTLYMKGYFDVGPIALGLAVREWFDEIAWVDIGANIGTTSIPLAVNGVECIGIEANPATFSELKKNIGLNDLRNYESFNYALVGEREYLDTEYQAKLFVSNGNTGAASLHKGWNPSRATKSHEVLCEKETLGRILRASGLSRKRFIIKIDIEGGELNALSSAKDIIRESKPIVVLEWNRYLTKNERDLVGILELLEGYSARSLGKKLYRDGNGTRRMQVMCADFDPDMSYENIVLFDASDDRLCGLIDGFNAEIVLD